MTKRAREKASGRPSRVPNLGPATRPLVLAVVASVALGAASAAAADSTASGTPATTSAGLPVQVTFNANSATPQAAVSEMWTVPANVTEVTFYVNGGAGGAGGQPGGQQGAAGGTGGTLQANMAVTPGQTYAITVGGSGAAGASTDSGLGITGGAPGAPGGGQGGAGSVTAPNAVGGGGGGGGESIVALVSGTTNTTELLAPGGGGGGGGNGSTQSGGTGGDGAIAGTGSVNGAGGGGAGTGDQAGTAGASVNGSFGQAGSANQGGSGMSPAFGGGVGGGGGGVFGGGSGGGSTLGAGGGGGGGFFVTNTATNVVQHAGASAGQVEIGYSVANQPPPPPPVTIVVPHPAISGVAAIGSPLTCNPGVAAGAQATITYSWLRDTSAISGATSGTYTVVAGDAGHHLQCLVATANSAGTASKLSVFVSVPAQGVAASISTTVVGHARDRLGHPYVNVICSAQTPQGCTIKAAATIKSGGRTVTIGKTTVHIASGQTKGISVPLTASATKLLAKQRRLPATLTVNGTLVGVFSKKLSTQKVTVVAPKTLKARRSR